MVSLDTELLRVHLQVNGDAFIGRTYDNGDDFKRLNFSVSEVSSSAAWVKVNVQCLELCHVHIFCAFSTWVASVLQTATLDPSA